MLHRYVVLGAGRQGVAAAYDMARFGEAGSVTLADQDRDLANTGATRVNQLLGSDLVRPDWVDVSDKNALTALLTGATVALSAAPYRFNGGITRAAIAAQCHLCDLGGNTDVVREQLALDPEARSAGIAIVPDCGLQPGMGNTLAVHLMSLMSDPKEARIWVGGLPQHPKPPFDYLLSFNIEGLTNEYDEMAVVLRDGKVAGLPPFSEVERLVFPDPAGACEAFITTGGTSTCPWTFEGHLVVYEEKTVRYRGHAAAFRAFRELGLFGREPVCVGKSSVVPRDLYHELLASKISYPEDRDLIVLRVSCKGLDKGLPKEIVWDMIDLHDEETGFRAMERTTGWSAAIVAQMLARGEIQPGAIPLEKSVPPATFLAEARKRGFVFTERVIQGG